VNTPHTIRSRPGPLRRSVGRAAVALAWLTGVAAATGSFFAADLPRGRELRLDVMDLLGFGCPMAVACAVAAAVTLAVAGRKRAALEVALVLAAATAVSAVVSYTLLWPAPWVVRGRMGFWEFEQLRQSVWVGGFTGAWVYAPMGAAAGGMAGGLAGLLAFLARTRPRGASAAALALLAACASEPVQRLASGVVAWWAATVMRWNMGWPLAAEPVLALGAAVGALAGGAAACLALWYWGRTAEPGAAPGYQSIPTGPGRERIG